MASAYIDIKPEASRQAAEVRQAIDTLQGVIEKFAEIKAQFDQIALGGDYVALAGFLGVTEAQATAVYALWGSANNELVEDTFIAQLLARCG